MNKPNLTRLADERPVGFVVVDAATIRKTLDALRPAPRTTCWHCGARLTNGTCSRCDR